jgi:hypothetical protein
MMFGKIGTGVALLFSLVFAAHAADKLAVAEPINKSGLPEKEIKALWTMLESSVDGGYEVVSRAALKTMMTEIKLSASSNLVNLSSLQKARLGEIKTVKYLLVPTISKFGSKLQLDLVLVDSSTGTIDPERKTSETFQNLDELRNKLNDILLQIKLGREIKKSGRSAVLTPVIKVKNAPAYLADDFSTELESVILDAGIKLYNLKSVKKIFAENKIDSLDEAEPAMYAKIGKLLRADYLVQPTITRFDRVVTKRYIRASKREVSTSVGNIEGNIKVISAKTGDKLSSVKFRLKVDFADIDKDTDNWSAQDYGGYLIENVMPEASREAVKVLKR